MSTNSLTAPGSGTAHRQASRVLVVDDSAIVRGLIVASLEKDGEIEVVATASNGALAIDALKRWDPDVIVLDIEMPVMDGLTALPKLLAANPDVKVIIASTLTRRGAEITLRALAAGAADCIAKPSTGELRGAEGFSRELTAKVKALAHARRNKRVVARPAARPVLAPVAQKGMPAETPVAVAIISSTGGPQALLRVSPTLKEIRQPIFITQHMPATFTSLLAEHVGRASGRPTIEAQDGLVVEAGHTYIAAGDFHMVIEGNRNAQKIRLTQTPPENFCRPSADPMLRSLVECFGRQLLCVVLTGMGQDGLLGCRQLVAAGGTVVAQDEATSVVWGMPGAVAHAGICAAILPVEQVGPWVLRAAGGARQ
jgi:two-component system chemotaxis response regulator CheB